MASSNGRREEERRARFINVPRPRTSYPSSTLLCLAAAVHCAGALHTVFDNVADHLHIRLEYPHFAG